MSLNNSGINIQCFHYRRRRRARRLGAASGEESAQTTRYGSFQGKKEGREFFLLRFHWRTTLHVWFMNVNRMRSKVFFVCFHIYKIFPFPLKATGKNLWTLLKQPCTEPISTPCSNKINPPNFSHSHAGQRGLIPSRLLSATDSGHLCAGKSGRENSLRTAQRRCSQVSVPQKDGFGRFFSTECWRRSVQKSAMFLRTDWPLSIWLSICQIDSQIDWTEERAAVCNWQTLARSSSYVFPQWNMMSFVSQST